MAATFLKYFVILILVFPTMTFGQQNPYNDRVNTVLSSKTPGQSVMLTGKIKELKTGSSFILDDQTGFILIKSDKEVNELQVGDEITLNGKVQIDEGGNKEILIESFRKLKFVKDPSNCCKPEKE